MDVFLTPCRLMRGAESIAGARRGVGGPERRHMGPLGGLADDKVARLRVNLCYHLRLVIVSGVLVPTEQPPFMIHAAHRKQSFL